MGMNMNNTKNTVCYYCTGDLEGYTKVIKEWKGPGRMYIPEGEANLVVSGRYSHRACIPIKFCPFCGRSLTKNVIYDKEVN